MMTMMMMMSHEVEEGGQWKRNEDWMRNQVKRAEQSEMQTMMMKRERPHDGVKMMESVAVIVAAAF